MLYEFSVSNYRSFQDAVTLRLVASKRKEREARLNQEGYLTPVEKGISLLHSALCYGANNSGKSNLVKAMSTMRRLVLHSVTDSRLGLERLAEPFLLSEEARDQPCGFGVVFRLGETRYRYGFEFSARQVEAEWLYHLPPGRKRESKLFEREGQSFQLQPDFSAEGKALTERTRADALFLSVCAQFNGAISSQVAAWFERIAIISSDEHPDPLARTIEILRRGDALSAQVKRFLCSADIGFSDIQVRERELPPEFLELVERMTRLGAPGRVSSNTLHSVKVFYGQVELDLDEHESTGTRKIFALAGPLIERLSSGGLIVVDEVDARVHSALSRRLLELFHRPDFNGKSAQLIATTHDQTLLDSRLLRRDQIWFVDKLESGASELFSLAQIEGVRNDASYARDYVQGRYGAVPHLGWLNLLKLGEEAHEQAE